MIKTQHRYVLHKADDGIIWCSLQPLVADIKERIDSPDTVEHVKTPLLYVQSFLEALIAEGKEQ